MTQQSARENERQMGGRRRRLRVKRQRRDENGATRADATISQGKQEGGAKASVIRWRVNKGKVRARPPGRQLEVAEQWGETSKKNNSCVFNLVLCRISTVSSR
jgi:hypothetical protein